LATKIKPLDIKWCDYIINTINTPN
jgi:hypothetical protein